MILSAFLVLYGSCCVLLRLTLDVSTRRILIIMQIASVRQVLDGDIACGSEVTIRGWVRTRRDSKAGFSFIHVNDGSGLNNLQLVAGRELPNYDNEIRRLTAGCAIVCRGKVVESRGRGQSVEIQAQDRKSVV